MSEQSNAKSVIVVGAGIVGVSTALWLQRDGHRVTLIDRQAPGEGTSHGNGGILASCSVVPVAVPGLIYKAPKMLFDPRQPLFLKWSYLPKLMPWLLNYLGHSTAEHVEKRAAAMTAIIGDSLADHQALSAGTTAEKWVVPSDYLYVYTDKAHYESDAFGWSVRSKNGFEWDVLEGAAFKDYDPGFGPAHTCAVRMGNHGHITDPGQYVKDLAAHFEASGGRLLRAEVEDIIRENGVTTGVRAGGEPVHGDAVVIATGVWSGSLAKKLGLSVPLESERGYHLELWEPSMMPRAPVMVASGKFVATPMEGRIRLAGIVEFGGLDAPASRAPFKLLEQNIRAAMPGLTWKRTVEWMGHRPSIADSIPLIGEVPNAKGTFLGFGHDHVGLTGGPKTGRLLAQIIGGKTPNIDLAPFAPTRFQ